MRVWKTWKELKEKGSEHYKSGRVQSTEPIDLIRSGDMLRDKALSDIIKYAYRNRRAVRKKVNPSDMEKIVHYAELIMADAIEAEKKAKLRSINNQRPMHQEDMGT
jgi:hypothetical protein